MANARPFATAGRRERRPLHSPVLCHAGADACIGPQASLVKDRLPRDGGGGAKRQKGSGGRAKQGRKGSLPPLSKTDSPGTGEVARSARRGAVAEHSEAEGFCLPCQRQTPPGRGRWREAPEGERWPPSAAGGISPRHIPFAFYYTPITTIGEEPIPALPLWVYPSNYLLVFASCGFKRGRSSFSC